LHFRLASLASDRRAGAILDHTEQLLPLVPCGQDTQVMPAKRRVPEAAVLPDIACFWRSEKWIGIELMRVHWVHHTFPKHFHDSYTIGINDGGAGHFQCRHKNQEAWRSEERRVGKE